MIADDWKLCIDCRFSYPLTDFWFDRIKSDNHRPYCKACEATRTAAWTARKRLGERRTLVGTTDRLDALERDLIGLQEQFAHLRTTLATMEMMRR